jgi:hypothetical protein
MINRYQDGGQCETEQNARRERQKNTAGLSRQWRKSPARGETKAAAFRSAKAWPGI